MKRNSLDMYSHYPEAMINYIQNYGKHFSKKMYEFAVSKMWRKEPNGSKRRIEPVGKENFQELMKIQGITLENDTLYDGMYVYSMAQADFYGSSIRDDNSLALYVKDVIDDPDAVDGQIFNRFYADCMLKGMPIDWDSML